MTATYNTLFLLVFISTHAPLHSMHRFEAALDGLTDELKRLHTGVYLGFGGLKALPKDYDLDWLWNVKPWAITEVGGGR